MDDKNKGLTGEISSRKYDKPEPTQHQPTLSEIEKLRDKFENFKKALIKKYPFTMALGLIPATASPLFEEDEQIPKEVAAAKPLHLIMIIPEDHYKNLAKIKPEAVKMLKDTKENAWLHVKTPIDLWNYGLDSKYEFLDAVSASFPLHDKGFLGALRVASIHKSLVLRKFEKYVASYVIGGSLVRGTAGKDSDVDTFVIIDDTDVKRMSRIELLEKLRGIIHDYIREASALAGVKNILNVQVYLLTDFWQSVKDAHPVMFTFIRDGIPFYDRGTFIPWKLLLKMGKIKPSPEAVDMFMKSGDQTDSMVKRRLLDAMVDIYWGIITPTQALMMLAGEAPPVPKTVVADVKKLFVDKEKIMDLNTLKTLEKVVGLYKDYEHGKLTAISGKEVDVLMHESEEYVKKMKQLREKLEARLQEHLAEKIHSDVFSLLKNLFGDKKEEDLVRELETKLIKTGKLHPRMKSIAHQILDVKKKTKGKKLNQNELQSLSRDATDLLAGLIEYSQRKEFAVMEKGIVQISYNGMKADLVLTDAGLFVASAQGVQKLHNGKLHASDRKELEEALAKTKDRTKLSLSGETIVMLKKELGNFDILF
ncbi:nucleotidyltransferase domain-containing protein [Candidatus Pacearchaeota archaeon]|nr:nucleotidyltransferase domain-containing protein [Candidatus Pacearchaeota archaeon]